MSQTATLILTKGKIHTLDRENPLTEAVAIAGKIVRKFDFGLPILAADVQLLPRRHIARRDPST